jgi:hypothetical protein
VDSRSRCYASCERAGDLALIHCFRNASPNDDWRADPHTLAKHRILKGYLGAWFPAMTLGAYGHRRVLIIDGFAGPGDYEGGEEGP